MPYSNYFDNPYLSDVFDPGPDYTLNTFFDSDNFFSQPTTSIEGASNTQPKSQRTSASKLPATILPSSSRQQSYPQTYNQPQFGQFDQYRGDFSIHRPTPPQAGEHDSFSPTTAATTSHSSSHSSDAPHQAVSPSLSPHTLKRESPSSPASASESSTPKRPTRKRGRPRMSRSSTDSQLAATSPTLKSQTSRRQPHNQVERKYREGLNSELERLRRAVPLLRQNDGTNAIGQPKPSKATILASAIDYIQAIEKERDALKAEVEQLRQNQAGMLRNPDGRNPSLDEYLMDS
ncbi:hypothetical protein COCCADRAFT_31195 [Bipolaris zeicola 26-R-13]|uniref:BHLH domain-containing protein n=1 Tax=Cochliobolus carbonum (strain 26-R-13) TaxID=930089 RepID=W6XP65_COCC2|nr:uncharacterized protein COCCADRAFT_31195 [Bipolaris zeicola 26-R-13]EUC27288.1 hypothetical protein COCCADRAFT_31195 [Bipolaris zeicola 26-R-13]